MAETAFINVQCRETTTGRMGTFLTRLAGKEDRTAISPVFDDLAGLYRWMNQKGWRSSEWVDGQFMPWRAER